MLAESASQPVKVTNNIGKQLMVGGGSALVTATAFGIATVAALSQTTLENNLILSSILLSTALAALDVGIITSRMYNNYMANKNTVFFKTSENTRAQYLACAFFLGAILSVGLTVGGLGPYLAVDKDDPAKAEFKPMAMGFMIFNLVSNFLAQLMVAGSVGLKIVQRSGETLGLTVTDAKDDPEYKKSSYGRRAAT